MLTTAEYQPYLFQIFAQLLHFHADVPAQVSSDCRHNSIYTLIVRGTVSLSDPR